MSKTIECNYEEESIGLNKFSHMRRSEQKRDKKRKERKKKKKR